MAYTPKLGSGSAFKNTRKSKDSQPDYRGDFVGLDGVKYSVALWERQGPKGAFFSMAVSTYSPPPPRTPLEAALEAVDDIPF